MSLCHYNSSVSVTCVESRLWVQSFTAINSSPCDSNRSKATITVTRCANCRYIYSMPSSNSSDTLCLVNLNAGHTCCATYVRRWSKRGRFMDGYDMPIHAPTKSIRHGKQQLSPSFNKSKPHDFPWNGHSFLYALKSELLASIWHEIREIMVKSGSTFPSFLPIPFIWESLVCGQRLFSSSCLVWAYLT